MARHCDRLFPPDLAQVEDAPAEAAKIRKKYTVLGRNNERKRLASQLELKMRALYYDVIDPAAVEGYIASIYQQVDDVISLQSQIGAGVCSESMWLSTVNLCAKHMLFSGF